jgi:hypothetical protein
MRSVIWQKTARLGEGRTAMPINHDFWLFREGERAYTHYSDLLPRRDAPVSIDDEVLKYFVDTLEWIPTFNPAKNEQGNGLNLWGPTIIAQRGGVLFHHIFATWAQLFTYGPEHFQLQGCFEWNWPFDTPEHLMNEEDLRTIGRYIRLKVERERLVQQLTTLAQFGEQAATGRFFILHLGI